ncbi:MAG: hypothetical protein ACI9R3_002787 [Verrucomicrobiales bacterium]|jgi:hypothetical protein
MSMARCAFQITALITVCLLACLGRVVAQGDAPIAPAEEARPKIETLKDGIFRLGKIQFDRRTREIKFDAKVNMTIGYLEYLVVNEITGKIHESLLTTEASPMNLNIILLLLNYEASDILKDQKEDVAIAAQPMASMDILVQWKGKEGKKQTAAVESWVLNLATESTAKAGHWLYTGSKLDDGGGFAAETDGSLIAIYRDHRSLFNNPREGKTSDEIWKPAPEHGLPAKDTPVTLILRPHGGAKK